MMPLSTSRILSSPSNSDYFEGRMVALGRKQLDDYVETEEGNLYGICSLFDFNYPTRIESLYQPYRIMNGASEMSSMAINAIDGAYAICCESTTDPAESRYIAVVPYYSESTIKIFEDWELSPVFAGVDFELIDCGTDFMPQSVVVFSQNNFIVQLEARYESTLTVWDIICVDYSSPTSINKKVIQVDLDDLGLSGYWYFPSINTQNTAVWVDNPSLACVTLNATDGTTERSIIVKFNPSTGVLISQSQSEQSYSAFFEEPKSPLQGFDEINESIFEYSHAGDSYGRCRASQGRIKLGNYLLPPAVLCYYTYTDRSVSAGLTNFEGLVQAPVNNSTVELNETTMIYEKLQDCGFTAISDTTYGSGTAFLLQ